MEVLWCIYSVFSHETGHFTALNWALTTHVGCATGLYKDEKLNYYHLYCDYGPAGNVAGNEMYLKGDPCTKCPEGTSCSKKYKGLCTGKLLSSVC